MFKAVALAQPAAFFYRNSPGAFFIAAVQADFYNPISQLIVKITAPVLNPLRQILPTRKNWDIAPLLMILLQLLSMTLMAMLSGHGTLPPLLLVFGAIFQLMLMVTEFYFWLLIVSVVLSWISPGYSPFGALVNQLAERTCLTCDVFCRH